MRKFYSVRITRKNGESFLAFGPVGAPTWVHHDFQAAQKYKRALREMMGIPLHRLKVVRVKYIEPEEIK